VEPISPSERLERLAGQRAWQGETEALVLLDLALFPAFELRRPRSWELVPPTVDAVLETAKG
jgi:hypothetical protein